jgi:TonB-linked SusC/RagA family outer membrane protein
MNNFKRNLQKHLLSLKLIIHKMKKENSLMKHVLFLVVAVVLHGTLLAQTKTITGVVKDATNESIIGASVVIKGTTTGTVTNATGAYSIQVPATAKTLIFSYIGMEKLEVTINGSVINATLKEASTNLDELVVIGYGTVKKRDLTGSISSVKSADIMKSSSSNAMQAMQGKVPGLDITQTDGEAGAGLNINLRGNRSISASNSPLILVDGVEYGSTIDINQSDIESMEVLKDASSTAIYGTRGANGVILISTKRGKAGATKVTVNTYTSVNSPTNIPQIMYGDKEVQRWVDKANYKADMTAYTANPTTYVWGTSNLTPADVLTYKGADFTEIDIYNDKSYTNWLDMILQNGYTKNVEAAVSGGNEKTTFNISLGGMFEEGLMKNDKQDRYNFKTSIDHKISNIFKVGNSILFTYKDKDARNSGDFNQAMKMTSIAHPYTKDGVLIPTPNPRYAAHCSPLLDDVEGAYVNNIETTRFFGNGYLEVDPLKNMVFKSVLTLDRSDVRTGLYQDYQSVAVYQAPARGNISSMYEKTTAYTWENTLTYNTNFGGSKHDLTALLGHHMNQSVYEMTNTYGDCGTEHYYTSLFYDLSKILTPTTKTSYIKQSMLSYFGRLNYKFNEKYLLTASVRADGSSALAPGHKWGYFPSAAVAWRMNEESFLKEVSWIDNLKLRASYGITGNAAVSPYQTMSTLSSQVYYYVGGTSIPGNLPSTLGNSDLKWETTAATDFALDFGIFKDRISGSVDYYISHTSDLLYPRAAPTSSVYPSVLSNIGETKGQGVEVALNTLVLKNKDFSWDINWSYSTSTDQIVALSGGITQNINGNTGQIVGKPVSIFYDFKADGCWGVGEYAQFKTDWATRHPGGTLNFPSGYGDPGTLKIVDKNDDGKLGDEDKQVYNRTPKHVFGMNNTFTYQNLSLSVLAYARVGAYIAYAMNTQLTYEDSNWADLDYWTPTNTSAKFPSPGAASAIWTSYGSALQYVKADYIKIKEINLSYNLPKSIIKHIGIDRLQIYGSLKNFFTFSNIDNYDPERGGAYSFPLAKQAVVGLNIEL